MGTIFSKQIPYTIPRSAFAETIFPLSPGKSLSEMSTSAVQTVSPWWSAVIGVAAGTMSQLASALSSKVNKTGAGDDGSLMLRLGRIADRIGMANLCTQGQSARWLRVEQITAGQLATVVACTILVSVRRSLSRSGRRPSPLGMGEGLSPMVFFVPFGGLLSIPAVSHFFPLVYFLVHGYVAVRGVTAVLLVWISASTWQRAS